MVNKQQVSNKIKNNLNTIVHILKKTNAKLILLLQQWYHQTSQNDIKRMLRNIIILLKKS